MWTWTDALIGAAVGVGAGAATKGGFSDYKSRAIPAVLSSIVTIWVAAKFLPDSVPAYAYGAVGAYFSAVSQP